MKRSYLMRPSLTNKTDESLQAVKHELQNYRLPLNPSGFVCRAPSPSDKRGSVSSHVQVRAYSPPNWFSASGVYKKRRQIELRGLPSFTNWRFITLTIDQAAFIARGEGPLEAYLAGKEQMRRFLDECRVSGLWSLGTRWAWKLEFHRSGWPHWHLLVCRTRKMTEPEMELLPRLWALGSAQVEMIRNEGFIYTFKYAFKPVLQRDEFTDELDDDACCVPNWFLDYCGQKLVKVIDPRDGSVTQTFKPVTFSKVRFWQTSKGFYTGIPPVVSEVPKTQISWVIPQPVRVTMARAESLIQVVCRNRSGGYEASGVYPVENEPYDVWKAGSRAHTYDDGAAFGPHDYFLPIRELKKQINKNTLWKLVPLLQKNRLSLRHAMMLQRQGKHWKTS